MGSFCSANPGTAERSAEQWGEDTKIEQPSHQRNQADDNHHQAGCPAEAHQRGEELYDLDADPVELNDLAPSLKRPMLRMLKAILWPLPTLGTDQIEKIVDLQLARLEKLLAERKMSLEVTPDAKRLLAEEGYDPAFGARPLKRSIQRLIQNPLAMAVLEGKFGDGDVIVVRPDGRGGLEFSNEPARETVGA